MTNLFLYISLNYCVQILLTPCFWVVILMLLCSSKECPNCHHSSVRHFCWWNKVIVVVYFLFCICSRQRKTNPCCFMQLTWSLLLTIYQYLATQIGGLIKDERKRAMILLKHKVLKNVILRRTKVGRAADLTLPPRIVSYHSWCGWVFNFGYWEGIYQSLPLILLQVSLKKYSFDIKELDYYESLYNESQAQFDTYVTFYLLYNSTMNIVYQIPLFLY